MPNCSRAKSVRRGFTTVWLDVGCLAASCRDGAHELSARPDRGLHLAAIDDQIEHALLDQELAALEPFRQLLADGLFDDARAGKADQRLRLGEVDVAEHRELAATPPVVGSVRIEI